MTDITLKTSNDQFARLKRRHAAEKRFRLYGITAIAFGISCIAALFITVLSSGYSTFSQTVVKLDVTLDAEIIEQDAIADANYQKIIRSALYNIFPKVKKRRDKRKLGNFVSPGAEYQLRDLVIETPTLIGKTITIEVLTSDDIDQFAKGLISADVPQTERRVSDLEISWFQSLSHAGKIKQQFNWTFFKEGDSREPEMAGILGAALGSFYTLLVTLVLSFPIGIASAVYLEEFAPKNRFTQFIEININNLAAVPSIVFGILGLAVFLNLFGFPRSTPIVGGMVLSLMTLPTIIIAGRAALKAVPPSIREAAVGIGASPLQTLMHHTLPLAMPGMLTGAILGMAQALGETAPLLMIGMVAFIVDIPGGFSDPATVMPVQIYLWSDSPERAFAERTSGAILVLLGFLVIMNTAAVILRKKFEQKW